MEDQPLGSVQESEPDQVAVGPVREGTREERRSAVRSFAQPAFALEGVAQRGWADLTLSNPLGYSLLCFQFRPTSVAAGPDPEIAGQHIDVIVLEPFELPMHEEVLVI